MREPSEVPVVIYAARSKPDLKDNADSQADSVESQIELIEEQLRHEPGRFLYTDPFGEKVSGFKQSRGPRLAAAISAAKSAAAEHGQAELWVFHSSRLARGSGKKGEARALGQVFYECREHDVTLRSCRDDPYVTDEAFVGMASKMANKYSEDLSAHVRRGKQAKFNRGERLGGPVPDGYLLITEVKEGQLLQRCEFDPARAPIFRRMKDWYLEGMGYMAIVRRLNAEGHRTKTGSPWTRRRVQDALTNPFYAGRTVIHRGKPNERTRTGNWPALFAPEDFDRILALRAKRAVAYENNDGPRGLGRRTKRYALSRLACCDRCGEIMYCVTGAHRRKDGTKQRSYVCKNVRGETGLCDQPRIDAAKTDAAIVAHLNRLFIDFEAWLIDLAKGTTDARASLETELAAELDRLATSERLEAKLRDRYLDALNAEDESHLAVENSLSHVLTRKRTEQERIASLRNRLASEPDQAPTDAMLDIYNDLARTIREGSGESIAELNERLRAAFQEFRLDTVDEDVVGVLPILRADLIERYRGAEPVIVDDDDAIPTQSLPESIPAVLFTASAPPPVKPLEVPMEMGSNTEGRKPCAFRNESGVRCRRWAGGSGGGLYCRQHASLSEPTPRWIHQGVTERARIAPKWRGARGGRQRWRRHEGSLPSVPWPRSTRT